MYCCFSSKIESLLKIFRSPKSDNSPELPQEIISEILIRLPVKSIGRLRSVSKSWLSLLTSNDFIKAHLAHNTHFAQQQNLLFHTSGRSSRPLFGLTLHLGANHLRKLEFFDEQVRILVGSCNGLVLVETKSKLLCLINCLTKEYVKLSVLPPGFDSETKFSTYGFGYDSLSDEYKIVSISKPENRYANTFVDIYSLKMGSWRRFGTCPYDLDILNGNSGVLVNGALHWTRLQSSDKESPAIVAFDLTCEEFYEIPAPASIDKIKFSSSKLMVIDGCLGIAFELSTNVYAEIWLLKSNESGKKLVIDMEFTTWWELFGFHKDKLFFAEADGIFKWYYLQHGRVEVCLGKRDTRDLIHGITYIESLVSPHFDYHHN